jgi:hypothetical protein
MIKGQRYGSPCRCGGADGFALSEGCGSMGTASPREFFDALFDCDDEA